MNDEPTFAEMEFVDNPEPRCPCVLLLDTSASMGGEPINALNQGLQTFQRDILQDDLARRRVEVAIVTFGNGGVQVVQPFVVADMFQSPVLTSGGTTPMGSAINTALDMLRERKVRYRENGIPYYRPWLFMITDGAPTDNWQLAAQRVQNEESNKEISFFSVGVASADMNLLAQISSRRPLKLQGIEFSKLFLWLSQSQKRVSASKIGELTSLSPVDDWAVV